MKKLCNECETRDQCKTPCRPVNAFLWENNRVMERHFEDSIVCYPQGREMHFSEIENFNIEDISSAEVIPWSSGDARLKQTTVFIERFFNKTPCKELAERFNVKENTIVCMYKQAVERVQQIIEALDARHEGLKATKPGKFSEDQKYFLLVSVFGFSSAEVARMFNKDHDRVNLKVKRMAGRFEALFSGQGIKEETPIEDPPMKNKLTRADIVSMVDAYTEQGLSYRQAFKRIADRYAEVVGRAVSYRGIESRYYKATNKKEQGAVKSVYDGLSVPEIKERMTL